MLKDGLAWLTGQLHAYASETVTYRQGTISGQLQATLGSKLLKLQDFDGGLRMEYTDLDFCISAADFAAAGIPLPPQRGDQIDVTVDSQVQTFEVLPFGTDPPWRWSDPHQSMLRIHCKQIDIESLRR